MQEKQPGTGQENVQSSKEPRKKVSSSWEIDKQTMQ